MSTVLKKILILFFVGLMVVILSIVHDHVKKTLSVPGSNRVIVIDAGHGGRDAGASGKSGLQEKDINLEIAKRLKRYIEEGGGVAIMIREEDNGLYSIDSPNKKKEDMKNRRQIITESDAHMLISIHMNSFPQSRYRGAQVFYYEDSKISKWLAGLMQQEMRRVLDKNNDRVEKGTREYYILKGNDVPSVLIECGFLSNPEDERLLAMPEYQEKVAWSIYIGILRFFTEPRPEGLEENTDAIAHHNVRNVIKYM